MTPDEIAMLQRIRAAKERNAAADLAEARATVERAKQAVRLARDALHRHDGHLAAVVNAFHERTSDTPITPGTLNDTRAFHADLVSRRFDMIAGIEKADELVGLARQAARPVRAAWHETRAALDRVEETRRLLELAAARAASRREESEVEEITLARRMRLEGSRV